MVTIYAALKEAEFLLKERKLIFKFGINNTSVIQSFFSYSVLPLKVEPLQAVEISQIQGSCAEILKPINSFLGYLKSKSIKRFYIYRTFALGDILMLVPVIRALRKQGFDPYIRTVEWVTPVLDLLGIESVRETPQSHPKEGEHGIMMDGLVEQDHMRPALSKLHRIKIYFDALGAKEVPKELDWSIDLSVLSAPPIGAKYMVLQTSGSTDKKRLSPNIRDYIVRAYKKIGIKVITLGEKDQLTIKELFTLIAGATCLIGMDSGPLWISHFTKTPFVGIFGPTRPAERLIYHPLWPNQVIGIRLNEKMNPPCESCFENVRKCNGAISCLKISGERMYKNIFGAVTKVLEAKENE